MELTAGPQCRVLVVHNRLNAASSRWTSAYYCRVGLRKRTGCRTSKYSRAWAVTRLSSNSDTASSEPKVAALEQWMSQTEGLNCQQLQPKLLEDGRLGIVTKSAIRKGEVVLRIPGDIAITSLDAATTGVSDTIASDRSPLVSLTLWLMAQSAAGVSSSWYPLLQTLPECTLSPILWSEEELASLRGSRVLNEAQSRAAALKQEWGVVSAAFQGDTPSSLDGCFDEESFLKAFTVILAHTTYLPSAQCFALLPIACLMSRTGSEDGCSVDYDVESECVLVTATRAYREGEELSLYDGKPNGERMLSMGCLEKGNPADCLEVEVELVATDGLYRAKREVLEALGLEPKQSVPIFKDRIPGLLLSYLRLSRVQDPTQLMKVRFDEDVIVDDMNEYEVLQLLMGECRTRLGAYMDNLEDDLKALQQPDLRPKERLARQLLLGEKTILQETLNAVRKRLAPIRGIPAKGGKLTNPNQDILDVFETIEGLPNKPKEILDGFLSWAKGGSDSSKGERNR